MAKESIVEYKDTQFKKNGQRRNRNHYPKDQKFWHSFLRYPPMTQSEWAKVLEVRRDTIWLRIRDGTLTPV